MKYYIFLINRSIPTKEEFGLDCDGKSDYENIIFVCLKNEEKIKDYILSCDNEDKSLYYFVFGKEIKAKCKIYSYNRYDGYLKTYADIISKISDIRALIQVFLEHHRVEECEIPEYNEKINIYSNKEVKNNFLNVIKIDENDILKCYLEELNCDHEYDAFFYYLFDKELYKIDLRKPYLHKEKYVANKVNQLEKLDKQNIANNIRINKRFVIYLIDSDEININTNMNYIFIKVKDKTEMLRSIAKMSMTFCYSVYFVIKNNDTICLKWKLMNFRSSRLIKNIEDEININIYSDKEIEGYNTIIAPSSLQAYKIEMHKSHFRRNGYFLYVKDGVITRLSIYLSNRKQRIVQGNLKEIIDEATRLDWEFPSYW